MLYHLPIGTAIEERIKGVQTWLLSQQLESNGSWNNSPWQTADAIIALIDTGIDPNLPHFEKAYQWLIDQRIDEGKDKKGSQLISWESWTWDTALVLRAIQRLPFVGKDTYIRDAMNWMIKTEKETVGRGDIGVAFGRCYTAQVILAMLENQNNDTSTINQFVKSLQVQQEPNGSWGNHFDTGQVVEALVAAKTPTTWMLHFDGKDVNGGLDNTAAWIERTQSKYGNWDGSTWSTMFALRAYLLAAKNPQTRTVNLAVNWILDNRAVKNDSWFHVIEHSASGIATLKKVLDFLEHSDIKDLSSSVTLRFWIADQKEHQQAQSKIELEEQLEKEGLRRRLNEAEEAARKAEDKVKAVEQRYNNLRKTLIRGLLVGTGIFALVAAILGFVFNQSVTFFVLAVISITQGFISFYVSKNTQQIEPQTSTNV